MADPHALQQPASRAAVLGLARPVPFDLSSLPLPSRAAITLNNVEWSGDPRLCVREAVNDAPLKECNSSQTQSALIRHIGSTGLPRHLWSHITDDRVKGFLMAVLSCSLDIPAHRARVGRGTQGCPLCGCSVATLCHVLLRCPSLQSQRDRGSTWLRGLVSSCGDLELTSTVLRVVNASSLMPEGLQVSCFLGLWLSRSLLGDAFMTVVQACVTRAFRLWCAFRRLERGLAGVAAPPDVP